MTQLRRLDRPLLSQCCYLFCAAIVVLAWWSAASSAMCQETAQWRIWTAHETRRFLRSAPEQGESQAELAAARNEWVSLQILTRSGRPLRITAVELPNLSGPGSATIPAREMRLYRQHQFELTRPSYRNDAFEPGWYPDALIPSVHPLTGEELTGARFRALPFDLPADQTHGFWIDIRVPEEVPAGRYSGQIVIRADDQPPATVGVQLDVWDFSLPDVPTLHTAFGSPAQRMRRYYRQLAEKSQVPEPDWQAVETQCAALLSEHCFSPLPPAEWLQPQKQDNGSYIIPEENVERLRRFVDRYHPNAIRLAHPSSVVSDPEEQFEELSHWLGAFDRMIDQLDKDDLIFYIYLKDEPNDAEAYEYVRHWGTAIRRTGTAVRVLVVEQTWPQKDEWGPLYGAVDIWCPLFPLFRADRAAERMKQGELVWTYTALCQQEPTPWWQTDFPLLHYRVPAWIAWRYRIRGLLYWGGMSYWYDAADPWTDPVTLDRSDRREDLIFQGEGSLVYPGRDVGYDGIAPSIRLKALRDAIEDYEYMAILERCGAGEAAQQVVQPLAESWFEWDPDPLAYEQARRRLGEMIENLPPSPEE